MLKKSVMIIGVALAFQANLGFAGKAQELSKCKSDNAKEGQAPGVVDNWCKCIWDKMPDAASGTLNNWAKKHKAADESCSKKVGWKD